jgi:dimethylsulfide dehydrogenase subunit gamma/complex iron-sulfur molybdoenzyme family reductase subunit gamma
MKRTDVLMCVLVASAALLTALFWSRAVTAPAGARTADKAEEPAALTTLTPATRLRISIHDARGSAASLLKDEPKAWSKAPVTRVLLNRTPRIFQTEPRTTAAPPILQVRGLRAKGKLYLRLEWADATLDAPRAPPKRAGEGGEPARLYKRPTGQTSAFSDAAAVMAPHEWRGPAFPSLQMGDKQVPVRLYHWTASTGAEEMTATGRTTPRPTGKKIRHAARHPDGKWVVVFEIPDRPDGWPVAFAVWDGHNQDRDGRKAFSLWYVLKNAPAEGTKR